MTLRLILALAVFASVGLAVYAWRRPPRRLGSASLASLGIREPAIVQFTTATCAPCKVAAPKLRATADNASIPYHQVDIGERPEVARAFGIRRVPTIALTGAGGRVVGVWTGLDEDISRAALAGGSITT